MDLTYNPGELDFKHLQKENSGMKRDHDSVDDFEHLDPESSPVDILSKPLTEIGSKSDIVTPLKTDFSVPVSKNEHIPTTEDSPFSNTFSDVKNTLSDVNLGTQSKSSIELDSKITPPNFENVSDSIKMTEKVQDYSLISDFISAEQASKNVKADSESDLIGVDKNIKDSGKDLNNTGEGTPKSAKEDFSLPAKSMKEADALSHYDIKLEKRETGEKDSYSEFEVGKQSLDKPEPTKEEASIEALVNIDPPKIDKKKSSIHDFIPSGTSNHELTDHKVTENEKEVLNKDHDADKYLENKDSLKSFHQDSEPLEPGPIVNKTEPNEQLISEEHENQEEYKNFPSTDDIIKHRICICPSKPETAVSDLDDIIGPEDVFKRIGLVEALVYWRDPKKSGVVFGGVMAVLLSICYMSLISVVGHFTFFIVASAMAFRIYKNILQAIQKTSSEGHPFKDYLELDLSLPQDKVREITDTAVVHINAAIVELRRLVLVEDLIDSAKFALCMWCLTYVGAIFNGMTLVILGFVALFTVPKIYENNKASIDTYIEIGRSKVAEITSKVKAAVPIGKKEPEKDKEQ